jgi:hypothetical protein
MQALREVRETRHETQDLVVRELKKALAPIATSTNAAIAMAVDGINTRFGNLARSLLSDASLQDLFHTVAGALRDGRTTVELPPAPARAAAVGKFRDRRRHYPGPRGRPAIRRWTLADQHRAPTAGRVAAMSTVEPPQRHGERVRAARDWAGTPDLLSAARADQRRRHALELPRRRESRLRRGWELLIATISYARSGDQ